MVHVLSHALKDSVATQADINALAKEIDQTRQDMKSMESLLCNDFK